ncbi:MAG: asparagine synthase (glutamine-hydrolyzing) [Acidimicrobiia bacterium]|nr:asparagine synthase (glutamine-hydrolyzing) [Acidimicrobiia bacterium]
MCGLIGWQGRAGSLSEARVHTALRSIAHRGPDDSGVWFSADRRTMLGHVRLSIIGLDNGEQPLVDATGEVHCVVNGELYGYRRQRDDLVAAGRRFATESDSEVALALYERYGADFAHHLRGEFAVVVADERRRCLLAARDRFGIKPLYYAVLDGDVLVASEIKALLAMGVPARWDVDAFYAECHSVRPPDRTLFAGVYAVPPGCLLFARDGKVDVRPYWDLDFPDAATLAADRRSEAEVVAGFRAVLDDAVGERLVADVEVASYLSGGIDSCAVLGLAQRRMSRPIRAFTIVFGDERYNEEELARRTAELTGSTFVPVPVTQESVVEALPEALWHAETLVFNGHGIAKFLLSRAVRDAGIKVVFTGEGADEMLAGYPPFRRDLLLHNAAGQDPDDVERMLAALHEANRSSRGLLTADGAAAPGLEVVAERLGWVPSGLEVFSTLAAKMLPLFERGLMAQAARANPYTELLDTLDVPRTLAGRDPVNQSLYIWAKTMLANYVLTVLADRMEMAHSVEGRVPFLDHHVAEYVAGVAVRDKIRGPREKHLLREAVRDVVLPEVYDRQKHPFMSPPARDDNDALGRYCQDLLRSDLVADQPFFEPGAVRRMMDRLASSEPDERAAQEGVVLRVVSTCLLQQRFGIGA